MKEETWISSDNTYHSMSVKSDLRRSHTVWFRFSTAGKFLRNQKFYFIIALCLGFMFTLLQIIDIQRNDLSENINEIILRSYSEDDAKKDEHFCEDEGSLHSIAIEMAKYSAKSIHMLRSLLSLSDKFMIKLEERDEVDSGIFQDVENNLIKMLEGHGKIHFRDETGSKYLNKSINIISIENSFHSCKNEIRPCKAGTSCNEVARILIQTEQVSVVSKANQRIYTECLKKCAQSWNCMIWDYSDINYNWMINDINIPASRILLIPHMIQNRLKPSLPSQLKPLRLRRRRAVMFGVVETSRRQLLLKKLHENLRNSGISVELWAQNIGTSNSTKNKYMSKMYAESQFCVNLHSYSNFSPGELHRLSEIVQFQCIPIFEEFFDKIGIEAYTKCGGVLFTSFQNFIKTINTGLEMIEGNHYSNNKFSNWWATGIRWQTLLHDIMLFDNTLED